MQSCMFHKKIRLRKAKADMNLYAVCPYIHRSKKSIIFKPPKGSV